MPKRAIKLSVLGKYQSILPVPGQDPAKSYAVVWNGCRQPVSATFTVAGTTGQDDPNAGHAADIAVTVTGPSRAGADGSFVMEPWATKFRSASSVWFSSPTSNNESRSTLREAPREIS